jgi:hypothetical protein
MRLRSINDELYCGGDVVERVLYLLLYVLVQRLDVVEL